MLRGAAQESQEGSQSADPEAAVRTLGGVELKAPAAAPTHVALEVMREVLLRPSMIIACSMKAHQSRSSARAWSVPVRRNDQLSVFTPTPPLRGVWKLD